MPSRLEDAKDRGYEPDNWDSASGGHTVDPNAILEFARTVRLAQDRCVECGSLEHGGPRPEDPPHPNCHICPAPATHQMVVNDSDEFFYCEVDLEVARADLDDTPMSYVALRLGP